MKSVLITPKTATEYKFINELLKKLGVTAHTLSEEEIEDIGLSQLLKSVDKTKRVTKGNIIQKLKIK